LIPLAGASLYKYGGMSHAIFVVLIAVTLAACAPPHPQAVPTPTDVSSVTDLDGHSADPFAAADARRATVLLFVATDCPISNRYAPEIRRMCDAYAMRGIAFDLVYPDADLRPADARQHLHDYGYTCPAVLDPKRELVRRAGVSVTPEAAVFLSDGRLLYRGRIDDMYLDYGKARYAPTTHDLADVLESLVHDRPVAPRITTAVGCPISN
jgi:hypothetical protein